MADPLAGVLFLAAATNAMDVYSAVNSSPWTAENVTAGDPEKEASLRRYCMHAIGQTLLIDGFAAFLANGLWWAVLLGAIAECAYMTWLYYDAVKRGRKTKGSSSDFSDNWNGPTDEADQTPSQGQFAAYESNIHQAA